MLSKLYLRRNRSVMTAGPEAKLGLGRTGN